MLTYLLQRWTKVPGPWFSRQRLEGISISDFKYLLNRRILVYELPSGEESTDEEFCKHGCRLFVEERDAGYEAFCLEHPEEKPTLITEDDLCRYKLSIESFIQHIRQANELEGVIHPCGRGYYCGRKIYGDKTVGVVLIPSFAKDNLLGLSTVKDCQYIFGIMPFFMTRQWPVGLLDDRVVLLELDEALNDKTFKIFFDWGIFKSQHRDDCKKIHLEITGQTYGDDFHQIRINGSQNYISEALFMLLLRLAVEVAVEEGRWVFVSELTSEGIDVGDGLRKAVAQLKEKHSFEVWDDLVESDSEKYRLSPDITGLTFNNKKLLNHGNTRVRAISRKLVKVEGNSNAGRSL